jgi:hypothetical protein
MNRRMLDLMSSNETNELTPAEARGMLFELARRRIDERTARPAITALSRIMRDSTRLSLPHGSEQRSLR